MSFIIFSFFAYVVASRTNTTKSLLPFPCMKRSSKGEAWMPISIEPKLLNRTSTQNMRTFISIYILVNFY